MAKDRERKEIKRIDRDIDKAVRKHGPGVEALAEAIYGKQKRGRK